MHEPTPAQAIRLTDQQTLHATMIVGQQHIPLAANGYRCQTADLRCLLLAAATRRATLEAACADLTGAPDANTVRGYLTEQLSPSSIPDLEQQCNDLLRTLGWYFRLDRMTRFLVHAIERVYGVVTTKEVVMSNVIEQFRDRTSSDLGSAEQEWEVLLDLLKKTEKDREEVLLWVFTSYKGYNRTRFWAGQEIVNNNITEGWVILEELVASADPDDRDVALMILKTLNDDRVPLIVKSLLFDTWPYLRFDAAEYLKDIYPAEVKSTLELLLSHSEKWVRDSAQTILGTIQ